MIKITEQNTSEDIQYDVRDLTENMESKIALIGHTIHIVNYDPSNITVEGLETLKQIDSLLDETIDVIKSTIKINY